MTNFHPSFKMCVLSPILVLSPLFMAMANANNTGDVEFDPNMLMILPNQPSIDIRRFNQSGAISAGNYRLDVYVNDQWRGVVNVPYFDDEDLGQNAKLCAKEDLINKIDLKTNVLNDLLTKQDQRGCYPLTTIKDAQAVLDMSSMRLDVNIPQANLIDRPDDYTSPSAWDRGVNSAFASYQFNHYRTDSTQKSHENYLGLNTGFNFNRWHFRHQGWARENNDINTRYQALNTYISTDIPELRSQLTLGDFYSDSTLFEGNAMRGMQMSTDDRMLPASLQGYAPTIYGIANSNAKVSIFQNNQEIYSTTVPAGAFELTNIRDIGSSGDLMVVVTEADGRQTQQILPYNSTLSLLRPARYRYTYAMGRVRHNNTRLYDDYAIQGTWQRGMNNHWTINSGLSYSPRHRSLLLGSTFNTKVGAVSLNATGVQYTPYAHTQENGHQLRLQYHRLIPHTKTNIHAHLRYYANYRSLEEILRSHQEQKTDNQNFYPKYQYQMSINQPLGKSRGNLYATFNRTENHQNQHQNQWQVGYSNNIGRLSYSILAQNTKSELDGTWDRQYMVNLSMPLGVANHHHLNGFYTHANNTSQQQIGLASRFENLPHFNYGVNIAHADNHQTAWSVNANYQLPLAKLSSSYSQHDNGKQYSFGATGAMVFHKGGLTGSNQLGDTFAIVHLPHGKGASLNSHDNITFNKKGYAIFPYLSPYRLNTLTINPEGLPYDVQLANANSHIVPIANSSAFVKFDSTVGRMALLNVKLANGDYPKMGINVYDQTMTVIGFVAQDGRVFLQDAKDTDTLSIHLDNKEQCNFTYHLPTPSPTTPISTAHVVCR